MAMHQPTVLATEPGILKITADGKTREAFISEGFIEVRPDETVVFSQAVEARRDQRAARAGGAERAEEMIRRNRSASEYRLNRIALQRAFSRLRVKNDHMKD